MQAGGRPPLDLVCGINVVRVRTDRYVFWAEEHGGRWQMRCELGGSTDAHDAGANVLAWDLAVVGGDAYPFRRALLVWVDERQFELRFETDQAMGARCHVTGDAADPRLTVEMCADSPLEMSLTVSGGSTGLTVEHGAMAAGHDGARVVGTHPDRWRDADRVLGRGLVMARATIAAAWTSEAHAG